MVRLLTFQVVHSNGMLYIMKVQVRCGGARPHLRSSTLKELQMYVLSLNLLQDYVPNGSAWLVCGEGLGREVQAQKEAVDSE